MNSLVTSSQAAENDLQVVWRQGVKNNYGGACCYCGYVLDAWGYEADHAIPLSRGGEDVWGNLVPACRQCNRQKGPLTPQEFSCAIQARLIEAVEQLSAYMRFIDMRVAGHDGRLAEHALDYLKRHIERSGVIKFYSEQIEKHDFDVAILKQ